MATEETVWQLDRKVPIAIIFTLLTQLVLGAWFVSKFDSRLSLLENQAPQIANEMVKLETAREATTLAQQSSQQSILEIKSLVQTLYNRSNAQHPEYQSNGYLNPGKLKGNQQ